MLLHDKRYHVTVYETMCVLGKENYWIKNL